MVYQHLHAVAMAARERVFSDLCDCSAHSVTGYCCGQLIFAIIRDSRWSTARDLPGHHASNPGGSAPADQEPHRGVGDGVPGSAHKHNDGRMEGIQLGEKRLIKLDGDEPGLDSRCCVQRITLT